MAAGQIYKGKNLRILADGLPIFHATSCSLSVSSSTDEVETKDTAGTIVTPGNISYTLSTDTLVAESPVDGTATHADTFTLLALQQAQTSLAFQFTEVGSDGSTPVVGSKVISGNVFVTGTDINADTGSNATGSHTFVGNGGLTIGTVA